MTNLIDSKKVHISELSKIWPYEQFEISYKKFIDQADENAISRKSIGSKLPYGISGQNGKQECMVDGAFLSQHYGQGAASKTPYISWFVVSIYYLVSSKEIVIGIEKDRYNKLNKMYPKRYGLIGNKNKEIAIFYEISVNELDYHKLYDKFLDVSEEVMVLDGKKISYIQYENDINIAKPPKVVRLEKEKAFLICPKCNNEFEMTQRCPACGQLISTKK